MTGGRSGAGRNDDVVLAQRRDQLGVIGLRVIGDALFTVTHRDLDLLAFVIEEHFAHRAIADVIQKLGVFDFLRT